MHNLALIGTNVSKSLSAPIYEQLGKKYNVDLNYEHLNISPDNLEESIKELTSGKYRGVNITSPYKSKVFQLLKDRAQFDEFSQQIGNSNTYLIEGENISGFNTDLYGIQQCLTNINLDHKKILIIGAGDVVKTMIHALSPYEKNIMIMNRTDRRQEFSPGIEFIAPVNDLREFDMVIKCTPEQKSYQLQP